MKRFFLSLLFALTLLSSLAAEPFYYFIAPTKWELADPKGLSQHVQISFIGKGKKGFNPSINLAREKTTLSLEDYLVQVKKIHESDRTHTWRDLGKYPTAAGVARLTEIESTTEWGPVRLLQLLLVKGESAYILTACATKEEFSDYYPLFQQAFRSLNVTTTPLETVPPSKKEELEKLLTLYKKEPDNWKKVQSGLMEQFADMGTCWHIFTLKHVAEKK